MKEDVKLIKYLNNPRCVGLRLVSAVDDEHAKTLQQH